MLITPLFSFSAMENVATVQICHAIRIKAESLITGTEKAQQEGIKFATIFSEYDIYSSNAVRTIQTAKFFSGKEPVVMDSLSDCNNDLYKTLESIARESHKRNIVIMTHNHCLSFLAR